MIGRRAHDDAQSFEDALNGATPRDEQMADLVRFAEDICEAAAAAPSPEFRSGLRTRLMAEAATTLAPMPAEPRRAAAAPPRRRPVRRRLATVAAALVATAGCVGIVSSSASALPGDMLYPVKRTVESVELQLHRGDASRGSFELEQAAERLAEARELNARGGSTSLIADTLDDFSSSAEHGSNRLFTEFGATGEEKSIRKVNDFVAASTLDLSELSTALPAGATDAFEAAKESITDLASEASTLCSVCVRPDVGPLLTSGKDLAPATPDKKAATKRDGAPAGSSPGSSTQPGASAPPKPAPTTTATRPAPTTPPATPAPAPTPKAPSLTDLTDPLLGGLLGDETQEGLVPGLLNGLLGGGATPKP